MRDPSALFSGVIQNSSWTANQNGLILAGKALEARVKQLLNPARNATEAKEPKVSSAPAFQFKWKGQELCIKVRPFRPNQENWTEYSLALDDAAGKYQAAFPAPEVTETQKAA